MIESDAKSPPVVLVVRQLGLQPLAELLSVYGITCEMLGDGEAIVGSFWGDAEAGLIGNRLLVRADTPVHSVLHEACHYICMTERRREGLHTDAGGDYDEENGVCYLQIILAAFLTGVGSERLMRDMDAWGYTFRLGSAGAWFAQDAEDAFQWLLAHGVIGDDAQPTWQLRRDDSAYASGDDEMPIADGFNP